MKREEIEKVVEAAIQTGFIYLGAAGENERVEEIVEIIDEQVRDIEEQRKNDLLKAVLKGFNEVVYAKITTITTNGVAKAATNKDYLELIRNEWDNVSMKLFEEFSIVLDEA